MSNKVQIGVDANVSGVESSLGKVESSAADVAKSVGAISQASAKASEGLAKIEASAKRLQAVAQTLSKEFKKTIDPKQAEAFLRAFDSIRNNKKVAGSSKLRDFNSFEDWHAGNSSRFINQADAERYKRRVMGLAGAGLGFPMPSGGHGAHHGGDGSGGHTPGSGPGGPSFGGAAAFSKGTMLKLGGAGLALAGVTSLMAMAGRAVDMARKEATSTDQLLRKTGDLTTDFDTLRAKVRASGDGLGVLHTEAAALAKQYVEINNGTGGDIQGNLRTGFGLSRAYGLELGEGTAFMAQSRHNGLVGKDDKDGRKFAGLIAEAIERGNVTGKAGDVLQAISSFSTQVARLALTPGNVAGFGGALAGLTSSNDVGLKGDPNNAAQMLMTVDNAIRGGGGMGEAGLNFTYGALSRSMPGLDPIMAKAIMEQGAFGSGVSDSIKTYAGKNGIQLPKFSSSDNLSLVMDEMDRQYGGSTLKLDAMKNYFGLSSYSQAAALSNLDRKDLTGLQGTMGDKIGSLSASGIQNAAEISTASDAELKTIAGRMGSRSDLTDTQRKDIKSRLADGDMDGLRDAMLKIVSTNEQQKNAGTETRNAVVAMDNTLTDIGAKVLPVITAIQEGVVAMASVLAPDSDFVKDQKIAEGMPAFEARSADLDARQAEVRQQARARADKRGLSAEARAPFERDLKQMQDAERYQFERDNSEFIDYKKRHGSAGTAPGDSPVPGPVSLLKPDGATAPGDGQPVSEGGGNVSDKKSAFLKQYEEHFKSIGDRLGVSPRVLASQFALETNWGKSVIPGTNNLGNIKAHGWKGAKVSARDNMLGTSDGYRAYGSTKEFAEDYSSLIQRNYPGALNTGDDAGAFARAMQNGRGGRRYAEDPNYVNKIMKIHGNLPADSMTGDLPAGNPAGSPSLSSRLDIRVDGTMRDSNQQHVADILPVQQSVSIPMAAGASNG